MVTNHIEDCEDSFTQFYKLIWYTKQILNFGGAFMSKQLDKTSILNYLKEHYSEFQNKYSVESLYLFGSYARDEQTENSDIDILVDFKKTPDLLTFIELEEYLSNSLQKSVDLVPKRKLKMSIKEQILDEAIAVWKETTYFS